MRRHRIAIALVVLAALVVSATLVLRQVRDHGSTPPPATLSPGAGLPDEDPLAWTQARSGDYAARATAGWSWPLYTKTADGLATAIARTQGWRKDIEAATAGTDVSPDTLSAIVLLESAGRPEAQASDDLHGAVGLTQIVAETGQDLLGLHVDVAASERIAKAIDKAARKGDDKRVEHLRAERRRVDERFDPRKSLEATVRYLQFARKQLGRDDLAIASYHMGVGNLQTALKAYGEGTVPYVRLYFDSTPMHKADCWRFLSSLGDDSATYLWRVQAADQILHQVSEDPDGLARRTALMNERNSAEVALHPPDETTHFADGDALHDAYDSGEIAALPRAYLRLHGLRLDPQMGELAGKVGEKPSLYRGLRREALATLAYIGTGVRAISGEQRPLRVTSTVRDERYQDALLRVDDQATDDYSLHTTGYAFDIARDYASPKQAMALQFLLDRLTALDLIAWVREPGAIHVTVSSDAARLMQPMGVLPADATHVGAAG
jgi:hypothetical protein